MASEESEKTNAPPSRWHRYGDGRVVYETFCVSKGDCAMCFGVSTITLDKWSAQGMPTYRDSTKPGEPRLFYLPDCITWRVEAGFVRANAQQQLAAANDKSPKGRLTTAKASLEELKLARMAGELLPADAVQLAWQEAMGVLRQRFLSLGSRLANRLSPALSPVVVEETITADVVAALEEVSSAGLPANVRAGLDRRPVDAEAAAEADGEPVGGGEAEA